MDYEDAVKNYVALREENKRLESEVNKLVAQNKEKMEKLGVFIQLKAEKDGLDKVNTKYGTVFWTEGSRCNVENGEVFFEFVQEQEAWELLEKRASKTAVADYVASHKTVPPGINFVTVKQINVRSR